jgi:hypothetical protein
MANFQGFPLNYLPMIHTDSNGTPDPDDIKHTIAQGWIQAYGTLNQNLSGKWENSVVDVAAKVSKCSCIPWIATVYLEYDVDIATTTLTFPIAYYGILTQYDKDGLVKKVFKVNGITVDITNIVNGDFLSGSLSD